MTFNFRRRPQVARDPFAQLLLKMDHIGDQLQLLLTRGTSPPDQTLNTRIMNALDQLLKGQINMAADLSRLQASVASEKTVIDSAVTLLGSLADQIRAAAGDPGAVTALADQIDSDTQNLAAAVTANTPAA